MNRRAFLRAALAGTLAAAVGGMAKQLGGPVVPPPDAAWLAGLMRQRVAQVRDDMHRRAGRALAPPHPALVYLHPTQWRDITR